MEHKATKSKAKSWHVQRCAPLKWVCWRSHRTERGESVRIKWNPRIWQPKGVQKALRTIIRHVDNIAICQHLPRLTNPGKRYWDQKKNDAPRANSKGNRTKKNFFSEKSAFFWADNKIKSCAENTILTMITHHAGWSVFFLRRDAICEQNTQKKIIENQNPEYKKKIGEQSWGKCIWRVANT